MKYLVQFLRFLVGLLFIFSGLVKANDPSGLANKMAEFFDPKVLNLPFLEPYTLSFSVLMIGFEIIAGVALILGFAFRAFSLLLLLLNFFFLFLTAYVYYWDIIMQSAKVRECGCFGDCIKISNSATFYKDIVITIMVLILFFYRKKITPLLSKTPNFILFTLAVIAAFGIQAFTLKHLPFHDCMPYKVGNSICEKMKPPVGSVTDSFVSAFFYKNIQSQQVKEFTASNYPWEDTLHWSFVDRKDKLVRKGNADPEIHDFKITDADGNDYTDGVLQFNGFSYLLFVKDPTKSSTKNLEQLKKLFTEAQQKGRQTIVLYSCSKAAIDAWKAQWQLPAEYYQFDGTSNKTAMRTDPGLMLLEGCMIRGKWSYADYPKELTK